MSRPRLLYIYLESSSFVRDDLALLAEAFEVRSFCFGQVRGGAGLVRRWLQQVWWLLRELPRADLVYGWFADYHMVVPIWMARLLRRPSAVALGGFEARRLPALNYGIFMSRWRAPLARTVLRRARLLLPVSASLVYEENDYSTWPDRTRQGIRVFVPDLNTPIVVAPTGYDPAAWPVGADQRQASVCTVAYVDSVRSLRVKGIDLYIEAARRLPDVAFEVIGVADADLVHAVCDVPDNVTLQPPVLRAELVTHYQQASVYAQLSRTEGLPNVLCEAMLCGCVPVGSNVSGIPDAIGETGFLVDTPDPDAIAAAIRQALDSRADRRRQARERIATRFHAEQRRMRLLDALRGLLVASGE